VGLEEDLLDLPAVGSLHRLVLPENWEEELVLRLLEEFVVVIQNHVLSELENLLRLSGCGGSFVHVPLVQKVVVRGRIASLLMQKVGETVAD
jgi:hypothetical protein